MAQTGSAARAMTQTTVFIALFLNELMYFKVAHKSRGWSDPMAYKLWEIRLHAVLRVSWIPKYQEYNFDIYANQYPVRSQGKYDN